MRFPSEMIKSQVLGLFMEQISLATKDGIKGKDDCLDTISMLQFMNAWSPNPDVPEHKPVHEADPLWGVEHEDEFDSEFDSYIV